MLMVAFRQPFPFRKPCPVTADGLVREPDKVRFDGTTLFLKYKALGNPPPWYLQAWTDEFLWLPNVRSRDDIIDLHCPEAWHRRRREKLRRRLRQVPCGQGSLVQYHRSMIDPEKRAGGGGGAIYLISQDGKQGSLCIPDNGLYNHCEPGSFHVGAESDENYQTLTARYRRVENPGGWVLCLRRPRQRDRGRFTRIVQRVLDYTPLEVEEFQRGDAAPCATGFRENLLELQQMLAAERVSSDVQWSDDSVEHLPQYNIELED